MSRRAQFLAVFVAALWGCNFVALHLSLQSIPPFLLLALRFIFVAFPAVLFIPKPAVSWRALVLIGATVSLGQFAFMYLALRLGMPAGLASLVIQSQVLFSVLLSARVLHERVGRAQMFGIVIGTSGLLVIAVARGLSSPITPVLLTLAAALSWSIGNVATRIAGAPEGLGMTVWSAIVVPLPALALSLALEGPSQIRNAFTHVDWLSVAALSFTVVASSHLGYGLWNTLLARFEVWRVAPFALLIPVFGLLSTTILLGERPGIGEWLGGAVLLGGVSLTALAPTLLARRRQRKTSDQPA